MAGGGVREMAGGGLREVLVLRGHLSSVRCLAVQQEGGDSLILVSAGGRAEVRLWRLALDTEGRIGALPLAKKLLRGVDKKKPWREAAEERREDPETRVMAVSCLPGQGGAVSVLLACSDAFLRLLRWQEGDSSLELLQEQGAGAHCLLQVVICGAQYALTGSTGGVLCVWRVAEGVVARLTEEPVHQSGVNCVQVAERGAGEHLVLTGGDDCALVLCSLRETGGGVELCREWTSSSWRHGAQVTGLRLLDRTAVSLGVDQRLAVWRLEGERGTEVRCVGVRCGAVADPQGLEVWREGEHLAAMAGGVGMELTVFHGLAS